MAKTVIFSLFGSAAAVYIDTDKYETIADSREISLYQRHMKTPCSYPNFHFDCANLHEDIKAEVSTLQCLGCQFAFDPYDGEGTKYWKKTYCAKDGSSYAVVYTTDEACQVPTVDRWDAQPSFQNVQGSDANRNCFTGITDQGRTFGCEDPMDIVTPGGVNDCTSGQCSASRAALECDISDYCKDDACDLPGGCDCDFTTCEQGCCDISSGGAISIAAYEWWHEVRSSSPYTPSPNSPPSYVCDEKYGQCVEISGGRGQPQEECESSCKKSQYLCHNNQCVEATSGGTYDDCSKVCQGAIAV